MCDRVCAVNQLELASQWQWLSGLSWCSAANAVLGICHWSSASWRSVRSRCLSPPTSGCLRPRGLTRPCSKVICPLHRRLRRACRGRRRPKAMSPPTSFPTPFTPTATWTWQTTPCWTSGTLCPCIPSSRQSCTPVCGGHASTLTIQVSSVTSI